MAFTFKYVENVKDVLHIFHKNYINLFEPRDSIVTLFLSDYGDSKQSQPSMILK